MHRNDALFGRLEFHRTDLLAAARFVSASFTVTQEVVSNSVGHQTVAKFSIQAASLVSRKGCLHSVEIYKLKLASSLLALIQVGWETKGLGSQQIQLWQFFWRQSFILSRCPKDVS